VSFKVRYTTLYTTAVSIAFGLIFKAEMIKMEAMLEKIFYMYEVG